MSLLEWQTGLSQALLLPHQPTRDASRWALLGQQDASKLALYQELMFNTVRDTLQNIYPFTYALLSQHGQDLQAWHTLVDDYRRHCPNRSYKLMGAISNFHDYLATQADLMEHYPFLADLALYEWLEMEVLNLPDVALSSGLKPEVPGLTQLGSFCPVWNPVKRLQGFHYNIPILLDQLQAKRSTAPLASAPRDPVEILIYRDPETLEVRFFCLNEITASLMRLSEAGSYHQALLALKLELPMLADIPAAVIAEQALALFQNCLQKGMLLGSVSVE
ncbi:putative DNA-binding domain-containing protein [Vampirovibrio sp.]|uniref:HvfC/BufC family peptide modification chaperone n=1 Tax=Vampirovibrio sp. TaxID=2717857 RepID=UPI0035939C9C